MLPSTSPSKPKSSSSRQLEIDLAPDPRNHRSSPHPSSDRHPPLVAASNSKLSPRTSSSNNVGIQSINCDRGVPILALSTSGSSSTSSLKSSSSSRTIKETDHTFPSKRESKLRDGHVGTHAGTNSKPAQWMASDATSVRSVTTASSISTNDHGLGEQGSFFKRLLKGRRAAVAASITSSTSRQSSDDDTWE
ncbi:hypothetical protein BDZ97DRAFT_1839112 [Flammula alnicola]|nr:hypothetical protein BDZ97DRAFT_1839112 [Flammula alnicola]